VGTDKPSKPRHARGESYDESSYGVYQSFNQDLLNDSSKLDLKDTNVSLVYAMQPKLHDYSAKNATKKQNFISIQPSPKKEQRSYYLDEKVNPNLPTGLKITHNHKAVSSITNYHEKSRVHSPSPSRLSQVLPKEPTYNKPRDSSANPYRKALHSRKNSCRPGIQVANGGKAWRPSTNQAPSRERGRSISGVDDSFKIPTGHENSFNLGSGSFKLNSSFQKKAHDQSFDYQANQIKAYLNTSNKRISYGGENQKNRGRHPFSPANMRKKNL